MAPDTIAPSHDAADHQSHDVGEVETIVREIVAVMTLRLLDAGKVFEAGALDEWRMGLRQAIKDRLEHGGSWDADRKTVLAVAADMATIAIILAHKGDVDKDRVDAAFLAVRSHRQCPPLQGGKPLGCWCDCF